MKINRSTATRMFEFHGGPGSAIFRVANGGMRDLDVSIQDVQDAAASLDAHRLAWLHHIADYTAGPRRDPIRRATAIQHRDDLNRLLREIRGALKIAKKEETP